MLDGLYAGGIVREDRVGYQKKEEAEVNLVDRLHEPMVSGRIRETMSVNVCVLNLYVFCFVYDLDLSSAVPFMLSTLSYLCLI